MAAIEGILKPPKGHIAGLGKSGEQKLFDSPSHTIKMADGFAKKNPNISEKNVVDWQLKLDTNCVGDSEIHHI
jgi:hypothetical protein